MCSHHGSPNFQIHGRTALLDPFGIGQGHVTCSDQWDRRGSIMCPFQTEAFKCQHEASDSSSCHVYVTFELQQQKWVVATDMYDMHSQKYLLLGPLQKTFANSHLNHQDLGVIATPRCRTYWLLNWSKSGSHLGSFGHGDHSFPSPLPNKKWPTESGRNDVLELQSPGLKRADNSCFLSLSGSSGCWVRRGYLERGALGYPISPPECSHMRNFSLHHVEQNWLPEPKRPQNYEK